MLHKQFEELTETGDEQAGIFFLNHATTYNNASVKVNPEPPPPPPPSGLKQVFHFASIVPKRSENVLNFKIS